MALVEDMKAHRTHRLAGLSIDGNEARRAEREAVPSGVPGGGCGGLRPHRPRRGEQRAGWRAGRPDLLEADRLDHGVRAAEDADLTARLVRERVPLNIA
ncbi:MAG: hypothetical protein ACLTYN_09415 [Dysosmobacter welbionis]